MPAPVLPPVEDEEENNGTRRSPIRQPSPTASPFAYARPIGASGTYAQKKSPSTSDPLESALRAPTPYQPNLGRLRTLESRENADSQPVNPKSKSVRPSWEDRLAAGMVGFGAGYGEGATRGIEAGSGILNRRYNNAQQQRQQRLKADQTALRNFDQQERLGDAQFRDQSLAYEDSLRGREANAQRKQNAWDRQFRTSQANQRQQDTAWKHNFDKKTAAQRQDQFRQEQQRIQQQNATEDGLRRDEIDLERQREDREEGRTGGARSSGLSAADELRAREEAVKLNQQRQSAYNSLENGNPAKGIEGYRSQLKAIQQNTQIPQKEKNAQIARLNAQHVEEKNQIERNYASNMNALGYDVQPVVYNANDQVENQQPAEQVRQQPQQSPPAYGKPIETQKTHQEVHIGQTVKVGTRLARIVGRNKKTGRPIVSYIAGGQ